MALKAFDASGSGSNSDVISALNYAVANGATISNNSYGDNGYSQALYEAIQNAQSAGHIFVAGAGNGNFLGIGQDNDVTPFYPASYNLDNIVAVAATDHQDQLATFSNYGLTTVDLAAPGVNILSTTRNNTYSSFSGTSMATPHVAGVIALVRDLHRSWTYRQVVDKVLAAVDPLPALRDKTVTGGRLNAAAAVAPDLVGARVVATNLFGSVSGPVSSLRVTFHEPVTAGTFTTADVNFTGPNGPIAVTAVNLLAGSGSRQFDIIFPTQSALGAYSMGLGPDILDVSGNPMDQDGDGVNGELQDRFTANFTLVPFAARFDYGTSTSPVAQGYRQVLPTTSYTSSTGHGWLSAAVFAEERTTGTDLTRDLNYGRDLTFVLDVPVATYEVTLTVGDTGPYLHDQVALSLEGVQRDTLSTAAGEVLTRTYRATVSDGQLTLNLRDLGGSDVNAVLNGLEVTWVTTGSGSTRITGSVGLGREPATAYDSRSPVPGGWPAAFAWWSLVSVDYAPQVDSSPAASSVSNWFSGGPGRELLDKVFASFVPNGTSQGNEAGRPVTKGSTPRSSLLSRSAVSPPYLWPLPAGPEPVAAAVWLVFSW